MGDADVAVWSAVYGEKVRLGELLMHHGNFTLGLVVVINAKVKHNTSVALKSHVLMS